MQATNFKSSHNKLAYAYCLTPIGSNEKIRITANFLKRKLAEFDQLKYEIETLKREVEDPDSSGKDL